MKNLKLLSLFSIAIFTLLSFKNFNDTNQIKDGTYDAYYLFIQKKDGTSFFGGNENNTGQKVLVKVQNNVIIQVSQLRSDHFLINQTLEIQKNGDAISEVTEITPARDSDGTRLHTIYKLKIKKEDLNK